MVGWLALAGALGVVLVPTLVVVLASPVVGLLSPRLYEAAAATSRDLGGLFASACVLPLCFQFLMDRFVFVRGGWFRHRWLHALYDYNFVYCNAVIGLAAAVARLALVALTTLCAISRLDVPLLG